MVRTMATTDGLETRRLGVFLAVAFGVAWATAAAVWWTGGLAGSPALLPGVTLALVLVAGPYMYAPALGNLAARGLTGEGWTGARLRPHLRATWPSFLVAWLVPVALVVLGAALYFLAFPAEFGGLAAVRDLLTGLGVAGQLSPAAFLAIELGQVLVVAPLVNSLFTFGEEFGWRGYLLPKLLPLGTRRALVLHGLIWGVWHWPIIAMGHNYGLGYPGAPWAGMVVMAAFTVVVGVFLGWLTLRSGSVWPATVAHAMVNGSAGLGILFVVGSPRLLFGPTAVGLVGMLPWAVVAVWLLARPAWLAPSRFERSPA